MKIHHRDNHEINHVSIHKIVISSQKVELDVTKDSKDGGSDCSQNVTKFDLKLEN